MSSEREIEHESHEWDGGKEVRGRHSKVEACLPQDGRETVFRCVHQSRICSVMELIRRPFDSKKPDDADYHFMAGGRKFSGPVKDRGNSIMH